MVWGCNVLWGSAGERSSVVTCTVLVVMKVCGVICTEGSPDSRFACQAESSRVPAVLGCDVVLSLAVCSLVEFALRKFLSWTRM